jgi:hypothetical protein
MSGKISGIHRLRDGSPAAAYPLNCDPVPPSGCTMVETDLKRVLVDLDDDEGMQRFLRYLPDVDGLYGVRHLRIWASRSKGRHAMLELEYSLPPFARIALQAILGSDPLRELLAVECSRRSQDAIVLFKPIRG